jgi:LemA protein
MLTQMRSCSLWPKPPRLKANQNFQRLQNELTTPRTKSLTRQFYNRNTLSHNQKTSTFPSVVIANMFSFQPEEFFEAEEEARGGV